MAKQTPTYKKAKTIVRKLNLKNRQAFRVKRQHLFKKYGMPKFPSLTYKDKGWKNWSQFLGNDNFSPKHRAKEFLTYKKAKKFISKLPIKSKKDFMDWKDGALIKRGLKKFPNHFPKLPEISYRNKGWVTWRDFLETDNLAFYQKKTRTFRESFLWIRKLNKQKMIIKHKEDFRKYVKACKKHKGKKIIPNGRFKGLKVKPANIPDNPQKIYKKEWRDWDYFLIYVLSKAPTYKMKNYKEASKFAKSLKLKSQVEWLDYIRAEKLAKKQDHKVIKKGRFKGLKVKPINMPSAVYFKYKTQGTGWKGWGDFLGTNNPANVFLKFRNFKDAKKFVRSLKLKSQNGWKNYCKQSLKYQNKKVIPSGEFKGLPIKPKDIPSNLERTYGTGRRFYSKKR